MADVDSFSGPEASWDLYEMIQAFIKAPSYHLLFEAALIVWIVKLLFVKSYKPKSLLTDKEKEELIEEWRPEPLVPDTDPGHPLLEDMQRRLINGKVGKYVDINGRECINMASMNFLGMSGRQDIEEEAIVSLKKYGVGSCGPRGFYGTVDVHLELEEKLAKFMNVEEAIIYSYGFSTIASAIPAYSKRGDVIFCDEGVHFAIQKGLVASRSKICFFKHNDVADLERLLQEQQKEDKKNPKKAKVTRRFLVVEGLYLNYGDLCPLPKLVELRKKYKVRIFMDETLSFGTIGATGKGVTEYYGVNVTDIDLISASIEHSLGSYGGFCCGSSFVVDHQRLSGLGYCFSASTPPMLTQAAIKALDILQEDSGILVRLQDNIQYMRKKLTRIPGMTISGSSISPVIFLHLAESSGDRISDNDVLREIVHKAEASNVALTVAAYLEEEHSPPPASIKLSISSELLQTEMDRVADVIEQSAKAIFS